MGIHCFSTRISNPFSMMKVLVAEAGTSRATGDDVKNAGHELIGVEDANQIMEVFLREQTDLILLDIRLINPDQFEIIQRIRNHAESENRWLPILLLAPSSLEVALAKGIDAGADDFLIQPVKSNLLAAKLGCIHRLLTQQKQLKQAHFALRELSEQALPEPGNRPWFESALVSEYRRSLRQGQYLSLLLAELDHFELCGHDQQAGNRRLQHVTRTLNEIIRRPGDLITHYDNAQFAMILPNTPPDGARSLAVQIQRAVTPPLVPQPLSGAAETLTLSIGVATAPPQRSDQLSENDLLKLAMVNLERAKQAGGNRIHYESALLNDEAKARQFSFN